MLNHFKQYKTYDKMFKSYAESGADLPVMYYGDRVETWKELDERANALANALLDLGYKKGDKFTFLMGSRPEYLEAMVAGLKTGIIPVAGINYRYTPNEIEGILNKSDAKVLFINDYYIDRINQIRPQLKKLENIVVVGENVPAGMLGYEDLIDKYPKTDPKLDWEIKEDDMCYFAMTGGTTGLPKIVMMTHKGVSIGAVDDLCADFLGNIDFYFQYLDETTIRGALNAFFPPLGSLLAPFITPIIKSRPVQELSKTKTFILMLDSLFHAIFHRGIIAKIVGMTGVSALTTSPMFHFAGNHAVMAITLGLGMPAVFLTRREGVDIEELFKTMERRKVAALVIVGDALGKPFADYLAEHHNELDLSRFMLLGNAGAGLTIENKKKIYEYLPHIIIGDAVGNTESTGNKIASLTVRESSDKSETTKFGRVYTDIIRRAVVIDPETGKEVGRGTGEVGELAYPETTGAIGVGYYNDPEMTNEVWKTFNGVRYEVSGDLATVDADGSIRLLGRHTGIINTGGEKVYAEEIEEMIKGHPKIQKLGITGVPDERWGEAVTAIAVLLPGEKMTEEELNEYCRGKMAGYKIPKHVFFVPDIPMSATGKAERPKLKLMAKIMAEEKRIPTKEELDEEFNKYKWGKDRLRLEKRLEEVTR